MKQPSHLLQAGASMLFLLSSSAIAAAETNRNLQYKYYISFIGDTNDMTKAVSVRSRTGNTIMRDVNMAFWQVSEDVLSELDVDIGDNLFAATSISRVFYQGDSDVFDSIDTAVEDVDCPDESFSSECLKFTYTIVPLDKGPLTPDMMLKFRTNVQSAIDEGQLYDALMEINSESKLVSLGNPSGDLPFNTADTATTVLSSYGGAQSASPVEVNIQQDEDPDANTGSKGMSVGGIIGIAVSGGLILMAFMYAIVKEQQIKKSESTSADPCRDLKEKVREKEETAKPGDETAV